MKITHVSDQDIQRYTFDLSECDAKIIKHIHACGACKESAERYLLLSNTIRDQPKPILEFNLTELVLDQLQTYPEKEPVYTFYIYFLILISIGVFVAPLYLFKETFINLFSNSSTIPTAFMASVAMLIAIASCLDLVRSFNKKINMLNY